MTLESPKTTEAQLLLLWFIILYYSDTFNLKSRTFLGQIRTLFEELNPRLLDSVNPSIHRKNTGKNLEATLLFVGFSKAFNPIHRGKIEKILLSYSLPKETVTAIMMLYKNMKAMVQSVDENTDFFDIFTGILQRDTLALFC